MTQKSSEKPPVDQSRRKALKVLGAGIAAAALAGIGGYAWQSSQKPPPTPSETSTPAETSNASVGGEGRTLRVFEWSGYEVEDLWRPFKEKHPDVKVEFSFFGATAEMITKLRSGFQADVVHPCSHDMKMMVDLGLVEPIDTSLLPHWEGLWPKFDKMIRNLLPDGNVYLAPADWGYDSVAYRPDLVENPVENSWKMLWDQRYSRKLSMVDSGAIALPVAGLLIGAKDPYIMTDEEMKKAKELLIKQKPLIRTYWSSSTDIYPLLISGDVVAALTWNDVIAYVSAAGKPIEYMKPKERRLGWLCGLSIVKGTPNRDLAHDYIDAWLNPVSGSWLVNNYYYGHANQKSLDNLTLDQKIVSMMGINDADVLDQTNFFSPGMDVIRYEEAWSEVKAA